jgi:hypothetical protein
VDIVFKSANNFTIVENFGILGGSYTANKPEINLKKSYVSMVIYQISSPVANLVHISL